MVAALLVVVSGLLYLQFGRDLQGRIDDELAERQVTLVGLARDRSPSDLLTLAGEPFAQIYGPDGRITAHTRRMTGDSLLSAVELERAERAPLTITIGTLTGTDEGARIRAFAIRGGSVALIAEPLDARQENLHRLAALLAIMMPAALLLASVGGYRVAGLALRPVEAMRERAAQIGAGELHERLPEPPTGDELERLAVTLNELLGRLEDALERERRIVGDASHELRTPISVLRTRAQVALRGPEDGLREALTGVVADAERLSQLADDLLVLARLDQGQLPLRREPLDAWDVATEAAARAAALGVQLELVDETGGGAVIEADRTRIEQLLDNLVSNAQRYGRAPITLLLQLDGPELLIAVDDAGDGFPEAFLPAAFDRFSQADASHGGAGSGLGLAIVEAIASAHGGSVTAGRAATGGARVQIRLPRA